MTENQTIEYKQSWRDEYPKWVCGSSRPYPHTPNTANPFLKNNPA